MGGDICFHRNFSHDYSSNVSRQQTAPGKTFHSVNSSASSPRPSLMWCIPPQKLPACVSVGSLLGNADCHQPRSQEHQMLGSSPNTVNRYEISFPARKLCIYF